MVFQEILVRKDVVDGNFPGQTEGLTRYKLMYMYWCSPVFMVGSFSNRNLLSINLQTLFLMQVSSVFSAIWGWEWFVQMSALSSCVIHYFKTFWTESFWTVCPLLTNHGL